MLLKENSWHICNLIFNFIVLSVSSPWYTVHTTSNCEIHSVANKICKYIFNVYMVNLKGQMGLKGMWPNPQDKDCHSKQGGILFIKTWVYDEAWCSLFCAVSIHYRELVLSKSVRQVEESPMWGELLCQIYGVGFISLQAKSIKPGSEVKPLNLTMDLPEDNGFRVSRPPNVGREMPAFAEWFPIAGQLASGGETHPATFRMPWHRFRVMSIVPRALWAHGKDSQIGTWIHPTATR